jgi:hypothetical protein
MNGTRRIRRAILLSIIGALCFSAGEGLRLLPFSGPLVEQIQLNEAPPTFEVLPVNYGPVDQPQSVSGTIKTKLLRLDCVTATGEILSSPDSTQSIEIGAITVTPARERYSRSIGRAPPSLDS